MNLLARDYLRSRGALTVCSSDDSFSQVFILSGEDRDLLLTVNELMEDRDGGFEPFGDPNLPLAE